MLHLSNALIDKPVLSLRTGGPIATTVSPIINPNNLKIEGFYCQDKFEKKAPSVLLTQDIREILTQGLVVNDYEVLTDPNELVRLKKILELGFELIGKPVETVNKEKVGKVNDFAALKETLHIQKLYVGQSLLKSLSTGQLSVDRNNIIEVTNKKIVIQEILKPIKSSLPAAA